MAVIRTFAACKVKIYTPDHPPPHFHVVGPDFDLAVDIASLRVMGKVPTQAREALAWASANTDLLLQTWYRLNPRRR